MFLFTFIQECGPLSSACAKTWTGLWTMDYGLWTVDCGLWTVDYGLWTVDYGLWTVEKNRGGGGGCRS